MIESSEYNLDKKYFEQSCCEQCGKTCLYFPSGLINIAPDHLLVRHGKLVQHVQFRALKDEPTEMTAVLHFHT